MPPKEKSRLKLKAPKPESDKDSDKESEKESDKEEKVEKKKKKEEKPEKKKGNKEQKKCEHCNGEVTFYYWYKLQLNYVHGGRGTKVDAVFGTYLPLKNVEKDNLEKEISKDYQIVFPWIPAFNHLWDIAYDSKNYRDAYPIMHRLAKGRLYYMLDNKGADLADEEESDEEIDIPNPISIKQKPKKTQDDGIISLDSYSKSVSL
jgi:hypothetical protein